MQTDIHNTRVIVANRTGATLYLGHGNGGALRLSREIDHPEGRLRERDREADRPGRGNSRKGGGARHGLSPQETSVEHDARMFALRLVDELEHERIQGAFDRLAVVAPPKLLGTIKNAMPGILRGMLVATLDKDMRGLPSDLIRDELNERAMV